MKIERLSSDAIILNELGRRLTLLRKQRRYTQERLAQEVGIGIATLRRIENGKDSQLGSWLKILKALDMVVNIDSLVPENYRSPMADAKKVAKRQRASAKLSAWGDETP